MNTELNLTPGLELPALTKKHAQAFQNFVLRFYHKHGRHELPWRHTTDPYHILVSELMLQQTQVTRVIPKYQAFLKKFPDLQTLSRATLGEVLLLWQGLGYNRRAKFLFELAQQFAVAQHELQAGDDTQQNHANFFPKNLQELETLPGIGPYTASAIMTFAYNQPVVVIETNIRSVFLYHFFAGVSGKVSDALLLPLIEQTIDKNNPKEWYSALMDYGTYLKKTMPNPSRKSKHHTKQSTFKGSLRQVRGQIIAILLKHPEGISLSQLQHKIEGNKLHFPEALEQLVNEKFVMRGGEFLLLKK